MGEVGTLVGKFALYEASYGEAFPQDGTHHRRKLITSVRDRGSFVVMRDEATDRYPREVVQQWKHRAPDVATNILEIDIDSVRTGGCELCRKIARMMVYRDIEAELLA